MSAAVQSAAGLIDLTQRAAFNPVVAGSLLWVLTKGPPAFREPLVKALSKIKVNGNGPGLIKALQVLLGIGIWSHFNKRMNKWALNGWRMGSEKSRWKWDEEVAVVTGGCSGIGEVMVRGLIKKGVKVAVLDIQQLPKALEPEKLVKYFQCDITDPKVVKETAASVRSALGPPSILINNAGIGVPHTLLEVSDEFVQKIIAVNLTSHFFTCKEFLPDMISRNKGHIVTVASLASFVTLAGIVDYATTKAALVAFHEGLNQELKHRYNARSILTTLVHPNWAQTALVEEFADRLKATQGPLLTAEGVGNAILRQVFKCESGQLILPKQLSSVTGIRGWPNWLQEALRDSTAKVTME